MAKSFQLLEPGPCEPADWGVRGACSGSAAAPRRATHCPACAAALPTAPPSAAHCHPLPAVVPDEPHQRGDVSLLDANGLGNIAQHVLSGRLPPADYQSRVPCLAPWRRKGTAYSLAPLGLQHPASARPSYAPLSKSTLDAAFTLQPGGYQLTEVGGGGLAGRGLWRPTTLPRLGERAHECPT